MIGKVHFDKYQLNSIFSEVHLEDTFKLLDKLSSVIFFLYNTKPGKFLFVSNSSEKIFGYPAQKFCDEGIGFIASKLHPDDYPIAFAEYTRFIKEVNTPNFDYNKEFPKRVTLRISNDRGNWIYTEIIFMVLNFTNTGSRKIFGVVEDISDEKEKCQSSVLLQDFDFPLNSTNMPWENHDYLQESPFDIPLNSNAYKKVTSREQEVLKLIADGLSAKEVADKLFISIHTVINHRKNLITKFRVKNTAELIKVASKYFWL